MFLYICFVYYSVLCDILLPSGVINDDYDRWRRQLLCGTRARAPAPGACACRPIWQLLLTYFVSSGQC